jgi:hypothetical protein
VTLLYQRPYCVCCVSETECIDVKHHFPFAVLWSESFPTDRYLYRLALTSQVTSAPPLRLGTSSTGNLIELLGCVVGRVVTADHQGHLSTEPSPYRGLPAFIARPCKQSIDNFQIYTCEGFRVSKWSSRRPCLQHYRQQYSWCS